MRAPRSPLPASIPTAGDLISGYALGVVVGALTTSPRRVRGCRGGPSCSGSWPCLRRATSSPQSRRATRCCWPLAYSPGCRTARSSVSVSVVAAGMVPQRQRACGGNLNDVRRSRPSERDWGVPTGTLVIPAVGAGAQHSVLIRGNRRREHHRDRDAGTATIAIHRRRPRRGTGHVPTPTSVACARRGDLQFAGVFAVYSYIEPMMTHVAGYSSTSVNWLLALFGIGMTVGNLVGSRLADQAPICPARNAEPSALSAFCLRCSSSPRTTR